MSEPDLDHDEFLLLADDEDEEEEDDEDEDEEDEDDETAADPPCKDALVAFLAVLGEPPVVIGMDLSELSLMSIISKLSWLSVLIFFLMFSFSESATCPLELLDRTATCCFVFPICNRKLGNFDPLALRMSVASALERLLLFVEFSWCLEITFQIAFVVA